MKPIKEQIVMPECAEAPPITQDMYQRILRWYRNKSRLTIENDVIPKLREAERLGYWLPGVSRHVRGRLNKMHPDELAVAVLGARRFLEDRELENGTVLRRPHIDVEFGIIERAPLYRVLARQIPPLKDDKHQAEAESIVEWCESFAPIAQLVDRLDLTRPKPAYVFATVSPTVFANIKQNLGLSFKSVRAPEVVWEKISFELNGRTRFAWVGRIIWPESTIHDASKFSVSATGNDQCQACGHAIRKYNNWVPLLLDGPKGIYSLWVGRDCASTFFGAKVKGDPPFDRSSMRGAS